MYDAYVSEQLHRHRLAQVNREAELMRRIAERSGSQPEAAVPTGRVRLMARLRSALADTLPSTRPALGK